MNVLKLMQKLIFQLSAVLRNTTVKPDANESLTVEPRCSAEREYCPSLD